jgi:hypothetical protein
LNSQKEFSRGKVEAAARVIVVFAGADRVLELITLVILADEESLSLSQAKVSWLRRATR